MLVDKLRHRVVTFPRSDSKGGKIGMCLGIISLLKQWSCLPLTMFLNFFFFVLFKHFTKLLHMDFFFLLQRLV